MSSRLSAALAYTPRAEGYQPYRTRLQRQPAWCEPYLEVLASIGSYDKAAQAVGVHPKTPYGYRQRHPEYQERCRKALVRFARMRG